ncbi:zinc finger, C2H2 type [Dictyocaulus viviparus]|uniref:Zinc finger, C2H2 type n=1 Tax=Dictyocaulus viviparus TaxID=29172 RepID=A0A0D8Y3Y1_DICVI|nr:zinc finger, C2H2 type [Dictyocaulus viviparus]
MKCMENAQIVHSDEELREGCEKKKDCPMAISSHAKDKRIQTSESRVLPKVATVEGKEVLKDPTKKRQLNAAFRHACSFCSYRAPYPNKVKRHIINKHSGSHPCPKCDKKFDTYSDLRTHVSVEHPKIHRCHLCSFSHKLRSEVRKHVTVNHINGVNCTVAGCNVRIARWRLRTHLETDHPDSLKSTTTNIRVGFPFVKENCGYKCSYCHFNTQDLQEFSAHMTDIHRSGLQCPFSHCNQRVLLNDLNMHLNSIHNVRNGDNAATGGTGLNRRITEARSTVSDCLSASDLTVNNLLNCGSSDSLNSSNKLSSSDFGLNCALCGRNYSDSYSLKRHVRTVHEKTYAHYQRIRKYACDWRGCNKVFTTSGLLKDHLNTHKGVKPYRCTSCDVCFAARSRFAVHLSKYHRINRWYEMFCATKMAQREICLWSMFGEHLCHQCKSKDDFCNSDDTVFS